jgi:c-di-GMP-binding flagellar brake protein YcgR
MSDTSGEFSGQEHKERRHYARLKTSIPVEILQEGSDSAIRGATSDISPGGCYIETIFPFPVGTTLDLKLALGEDDLLVQATVVTSDPQVGNGISFERMLPEDREQLRKYLEALDEENKSKEAGAE